MPSFNEITNQQLNRLIGTPDCPQIVDVRDDEDFANDPRAIPTATRVDYRRAADWINTFKGHRVIVTCQKGLKLSHGVAAIMRTRGLVVDVLAGGHLAWAAADLPLMPLAELKINTHSGSSLWVTRHRPKIDRIACPWLIRRFVDRDAEFLFVPPSEVCAVAEKFNAIPFDVEGVSYSHVGEKCSFDAMLRLFRIETEPLLRLANVVRGADTGTLDLAPEAAGLLAFSVGLSRMFKSDSEQMEAGLVVYDALFRWARDGFEETHRWPAGGAI